MMKDLTGISTTETTWLQRGMSLAAKGTPSSKFAWGLTAVSILTCFAAPVWVFCAVSLHASRYLSCLVYFVLIGIAVVSLMVSRRYAIPALVDVACVIWLAGFGGITLGLVMLLGAVFGSSNGGLHEYVTFDTRIPGDASIVVAKSGPFSPDTKSHLIFDAPSRSVKDFVIRYTEGRWETLPKSMDKAFPHRSFGSLDYLPEWKVQGIENGRFYARRTSRGTGFLFVDHDQNRVYLQR